MLPRLQSPGARGAVQWRILCDSNKKPGQVALVPFPRVDLTPGKPRPVLLLARVPGPYDDWLVGMFSGNPLFIWRVTKQRLGWLHF